MPSERFLMAIHGTKRHLLISLDNILGFDEVNIDNRGIIIDFLTGDMDFYSKISEAVDWL